MVRVWSFYLYEHVLSNEQEYNVKFFLTVTLFSNHDSMGVVFCVCCS